MAIAQTATAMQAPSTANPVTFDFNCNAGDLLVIGLPIYFGASNVGIPTYNGVEMTDSGQGTVTESDRNAEMWFLVSPAGGSNTISIPNPDGYDITILASAWSGVDTSDPLDISASNHARSNNPSTQITTTAINKLIIDVAYHGWGTNFNSNSHTLIGDLGGKAYQYTLDDGTSGVTLSWVHGDVTNWATIVCAFNPENGEPAAGDIESVAGVAWSDIHSIAGVLKADIQSVAGVNAQ